MCCAYCQSQQVRSAMVDLKGSLRGAVSTFVSFHIPSLVVVWLMELLIVCLVGCWTCYVDAVCVCVPLYGCCCLYWCFCMHVCGLEERPVSQTSFTGHCIMTLCPLCLPSLQRLCPQGAPPGRPLCVSPAGKAAFASGKGTTTPHPLPKAPFFVASRTVLVIAVLQARGLPPRLRHPAVWPLVRASVLHENYHHQQEDHMDPAHDLMEGMCIPFSILLL